MIRDMQESHSQTGGESAWLTTRRKLRLRRIGEKDQDIGDRNSASPRSALPGIDVTAATPWLRRWLALGRHGEMHYMAKHAGLRAHPSGWCRVRCRSFRPAWRTGRPLPTPDRCSPTATWPMSPAMRWGATTTRRFASDSRNSPIGSGRQSPRSTRRAFCLPRVLRLGTGPGNRICLQIGDRLARQAHAVADTPADRGISSARSTPICRCRMTPRSLITAATAGVASMPAPPRRSWHRMRWTPAAAFPT
jgi:hypothetical protein